MYSKKNAKIKTSERQTHSVAGSVTMCFDGCYVCCLPTVMVIMTTYRV